ncbi:MAG: HdeD family acid-resistance protein [Methyloceanibacter sp.]|jgi:uncharacterized membrane protein HdeD (DUF308 family)
MTRRAQSTRTAPLALLRGLAENWWLLLLRGIATIAFGVLAVIWPGRALLTLTFLWGAYVIVDGVFALWAAISSKGGEIAPRWWLALIGVTGILAGLLAFVWPGITVQVSLVLIGSWAIVTGVLEIWGAMQLRKEIEVEWMMALSGLLSTILGVTLIARPGAGALAAVWLISSFAVLVGCIYVSLALWLKNHKHPA